MSVITADPPVQIAFPKKVEGSALAVPSAPRAPVEAGLATVATSAEGRKTLTCRNLLVGETRRNAEAEAEKLYPEFKANTQKFTTYGTSALKDLNDVIDEILGGTESVEIGEATELMRSLNKNMRGIKHKHDLSDPDVQKHYEKMRGRFSRWFGRGRTMLEMLMEDVRSIEENLDNVGETLEGQQRTLIRNVGYYDEFYNDNEKAIENLIYAIAIMEIIRDLAANEAASIVIGDASLGDRGGERQAVIAEFAANMEVKIAEYKGRLFVAWATSPQCRMMRTLNIGQAEKLNEMVCVVIPTMKATLAQWRLMAATQDGAAMTKAVQENLNEWVQNYARSAAIAVPMIAEGIQTPSLSPQSIAAMADSISAQADGIINAMEVGAQRRQELDTAILEAHDVLADSSTRVTDAVIERIVGSATKPLEITEAVPA